GPCGRTTPAPGSTTVLLHVFLDLLAQEGVVVDAVDHDGAQEQGSERGDEGSGAYPGHQHEHDRHQRHPQLDERQGIAEEPVEYVDHAACPSLVSSLASAVPTSSTWRLCPVMRMPSKESAGVSRDFRD